MLSPVALTALDMAVEASGVGVPVLACGSARKLKIALRRATTTPQPPPFQQSPLTRLPMCLGTRSCYPAGGPGMRASTAPQQRWASDIVCMSKDPMRPHFSDCSVVLNPRNASACSAGKASWISDAGSSLSSEDEARLQRALQGINSTTGVQCAVVLLADLKGCSHQDLRSFRQFGVELFNSWGVGSADRNNGILLVFFRGTRRLEIVTGSGMADALPDNWVQQMMENTMVPHFRTNDHGSGLLAGVAAIRDRLSRHAPPEWRPSLESSSDVSKELVTATSPFHGGHAPEPPLAERLPKGWARGLFLLLGGALAALPSESEVERLERELAALQERITFKDAGGAAVSWPYSANAATMGLVEARSACHAFDLAEKGLVTLDVRASGFGRRALMLYVHNKGQEALTVELPAGSLFAAAPASNGRMQPLITTQAHNLNLDAGEEKEVLLDAYCGDSGAFIPRGSMTLSPYKVSDTHLTSQAALWSWTAPYQQRHEGRSALGGLASEDFQTLEESFGMRRRDAEVLLHELFQVTERSIAAHEDKQLALHHEIRRARIRAAEEAAKPRSGSRSGGGGGSSGFGGGFSSGGGGSCSW